MTETCTLVLQIEDLCEDAVVIFDAQDLDHTYIIDEPAIFKNLKWSYETEMPAQVDCGV